MAHEIEGNYAFFASSTPAWHGKGHVLKDAPSPHEAWRMAYPFEVFELEVQATIEGQTIPATNYKAIARYNPEDPTDTPRILGIHSQRYGLTEPAEIFSRFEPLIETGLVTLEAGGSLHDGAQMWALGKITGADLDVVPGDPIKGYLLFQTSFDGSLVAGAGLTGVRVVCANTLAMAQRDLSLKAKHTRRVNERLDQYRDQVLATIEGFRETAEKYKYLAGRAVSRKSQEDYVRTVIAPESVDPSVEISTKLENKVRTVIDLLDTQRGLELVPRIQGTAWQAYNAVSEYITHESGRSVDSRLSSQWFGPNVGMNQRALDLALAL